jgi:hypothetical protein
LLDRIDVMQRWLLTVTMMAALASCAAGIANRGAGDHPLDELWAEPIDLASRDLLHGSGGAALAPRPDAQYVAKERDTAGFSITYDLVDDRGQEWSVKIGPEAQPEVVSSRIVWAVGFRQPPSYYVPKWTYKGADIAPVHGRFRPKLRSVKSTGVWAWGRNPFVDTPALRGLKVLMLILNSTDLKDLNNETYALSPPIDGVARWFVVKDLGATLGETGVVSPRRGWIEGFEKQAFITGVDRETRRVRFEFHGRHREIFDDVTVDDVHWACERLDRLSDAQWRDAFRAGGYDDPIAGRFIARVKDKIRQGKSL